MKELFWCCLISVIAGIIIGHFVGLMIGAASGAVLFMTYFIIKYCGDMVLGIIPDILELLGEILSAVI